MTSYSERPKEWYAARFQDQSVVDRYPLRPVYPAQTFEILCGLLVDRPGYVLDVGCGPGNLARPLAACVERVDAVDISLPMLHLARTLPGGASPKIRWLAGRAEQVALQAPYALITAGESIHWLDWDVVFPRFASILTPQGVLALVQVQYQPLPPWHEAFVALVRRFSSNPTFVPPDLVAEFERRGLFRRQGETTTTPVVWRQSIEEYIAAQHARSTLSLETMPAQWAVQFGACMRELLLPFAQDKMLTMQIAGHIIWGRPYAPLAEGY
ncbi:MAG TPA: class I SAM-dependent methyltransferase [Ktedonobacteraceae bacterium]